MKRLIKKDGKTYTVEFDEYGVVDTVECQGTFLSTKNRVVQQILRNADAILSGIVCPKGFEWVRR